MSGAILMNQKAIAIQLRTLASDPENQTYIVQEGQCMKGLLGFLDSLDLEVLLPALQALQFLSSHPSNQRPLADEKGLMGKLLKLTDHDNKDVLRVTSSILENLQGAINGEDDQNTENVSAQFVPKSLYNVPLQIAAMKTPEDGELVEKTLLGVRGVVSITIDIVKGEAIVYSQSPESSIVSQLVRGVDTIGMEAIPGQGQDKLTDVAATAPPPADVLKPSTKTNILPALPMTSTMMMMKGGVGGGLSDVAEKPAPSYLTRGTATGYGRPSYLSRDGAKITRGSVTEYSGPGNNTLEARLKRQREKRQQQKKKETKVKTFFGAVTSYFF